MKRKWIGLIASTVLALGIGLAGTLAYFQDKTPVKTNVFTMGKVKIELNEPNWDQNSAEQKILVPGRMIAKDPTVTVKANSERCYVRVKVEVPAELKAVLENLNIQSGWTANGDYYEYGSIVAKNGSDTVLPAVFSSVQVKTNADLSSLSAEQMQIKVTAYAIQAEGFDTAAAAWAAFVDTP